MGPSPTTATNPVDLFAADVVAGRVDACAEDRAAADAHLRDRARENTRDFPYVFDASRAERFFRFAETLLVIPERQADGTLRRALLSPNEQFVSGFHVAWRHAKTGAPRFPGYALRSTLAGAFIQTALVAYSRFDGGAQL